VQIGATSRPYGATTRSMPVTVNETKQEQKQNNRTQSGPSEKQQKTSTET